jgi:hypothetical protein
MTSYKNLVADEFQNELIMIRDKVKEYAFRVGDITESVINFNPDEPRSLLYLAVGSFCGRSARTVRDYHRVSMFYPMDIRKQYEILAFDHFRFAMGDMWRSILDYAISDMDETGRPATVEKLEAVFGRRDVEEIPEVASMMRNFRTALYKLDLPNDSFQVIRDALDVIEKELEQTVPI